MKNLILAKFSPDDLLESHTYDVLNVMKDMMKKFHWIPSLCNQENFWELLFYSLVLHDVGKCASGFQKNPLKWGYRHEILSVPFASFLEYDNEEKNLIALSMLTHHKYLDRLLYRNFIPTHYNDYYVTKIDELLQNKSYLENYFFPRIGDWERRIMGKSLKRFKLPKDWDSELKDYNFNKLLNWYGEIREDKEYQKKLIFLKGLLNACDHLASFGEYSILTAPSMKDIVLEEIERKSNSHVSLKELQKQALETKGNVILNAPTGYGKTETSLLWAHNNFDIIYSKNGKKIYYPNRLFYVLPYKASINAMFERLKNSFSEENTVGVLHSSSNYYLYSSGYEYKKLTNLFKKIYSPIKVLTPFQIMKGFFGVGFFEMALSELSKSLLVFDEIHAYDENITGILLAMLEILKNEYDAKILLMSATMPTFLKELFEEAISPKELKLTKENLNKYTRHRVNIIDGSIFDVIESLDENDDFEKPLLITCNTVDRAIEVYKLLSKSYKTLLIHGRFTYGDREKLEQKIKHNLNEYGIVVSTQVIEVSLDISFNSIISEPAPLDALIQRFGRVNRQGWKTNTIKNVNILTQSSEKDRYIYNQKLVENSLKILEDINGDELLESKVPEMIDMAYSNGKYIKEKILSFKKDALLLFNNKYPLYKSGSEEQFYKLFKGLEVIPYQNMAEVDELIENKKYIDVHKYMIPISVSKYYGISSRMGKVFFKDNKFIYTDLKYDNELGLLTDELSESEFDIF